MFGLGFGEMLVVGLVALIAVGPKKLPGVTKAVGRGIAEFRNAMDDMKATVYREVQQPMQQAMDQKHEIKETSAEYLDRLLATREKEREETEAKANAIYEGAAVSEGEKQGGAEGTADVAAAGPEVVADAKDGTSPGEDASAAPAVEIDPATHESAGADSEATHAADDAAKPAGGSGRDS